MSGSRARSNQASQLDGSDRRGTRDGSQIPPHPFPIGIGLDLNGDGLAGGPSRSRRPVVAQEDLGPGHGFVPERLVERPEAVSPNQVEAVLGLPKRLSSPTEDHQDPGDQPGTTRRFERTARVPPVESRSFGRLHQQAVLLWTPVLDSHQRPGVVETGDRDGPVLRRIQSEFRQGDIGHRPRVPSEWTDGQGWRTTMTGPRDEMDVRIALDEDMERLITLSAATGQPSINDLSAAEARAWSERLHAPPEPPRPLALIRDDSIPGPAAEIPVRIYHPAPGESRPLLIHFHGGGWVLGTLDQADDTCRRMADEADVAVVSVDYRLAPEHPHPAPCDDAIAATRHVLGHASRFGGRPDRIGVWGDSAGGHLAAISALAMRDEASLPPLALQYLIYPVTDCDFERPSMLANANGRLLETDGMRWFWDHFCPDPGQRGTWTASPIRAESLEGVAPAIVALAAHDPLYSEGIAYARRLEESGVITTTRIARDLIHGYYGLTAASPRADREVGILNRLVGTWMHAE